MKKPAVWSLLLTLGMVLTLTMNILANAVPLFGRQTGEISRDLSNLFVPAGLTFSIWGVIYAALIVFTLYQLRMIYRLPDTPPRWWTLIAPWVLLSHLANSLWLAAWHAKALEISLAIMLILFVALLKIVTRLQWSPEPFERGDFWFACIPFSLYAGWISIALPANIAALLVSHGIAAPAPGPVFWTAAVTALAGLLGIIAVLRFRDAAYALVISWALYGISLARSAAPEAGDTHSPYLAGWTAALSLVVLVVAVIAPTVRRRPAA